MPKRVNVKLQMFRISFYLVFKLKNTGNNDIIAQLERLNITSHKDHP